MGGGGKTDEEEFIRIEQYCRGTHGACGQARERQSTLTRVRAAPLSPWVQSC